MSEEGHEEEINLDLLTKEFLEGTDPLCDNFDMVYSEEKLRSKLAELNRVKTSTKTAGTIKTSLALKVQMLYCKRESLCFRRESTLSRIR